MKKIPFFPIYVAQDGEISQKAERLVAAFQFTLLYILQIIETSLPTREKPLSGRKNNFFRKKIKFHPGEIENGLGWGETGKGR